MRSGSIDGRPTGSMTGAAAATATVTVADDRGEEGTRWKHEDGGHRDTRPGEKEPPSDAQRCRFRSAEEH